MRHLFDIPLGASYAPNACHKRIFNVVSTFFSGLLNNAAVAATNEANAWNTIATNMANERINDSQLAWAKQQYEDEKAENRFLVDQAYERQLEDREYNSPQNVRQRLIDAGFNPSLALGSGIGSPGHFSSVATGSVPHANNPNMIPMQTGAPMQPARWEDLGFAISADLQNYLAARQSEREDYRLASDITFNDYKTRLDYLRYRMDNSKSSAERDYFKGLSDSLDKNFALEEDKFAHQIEWDNFQKEVAEYAQKQKDIEIQIQASLAANQIQVGNATVGMLSQQALLYQQEMFNAKQKGADDHQLSLITATYQDKMLDILEYDLKQKRYNLGSSFRRKYTNIVNMFLDPVKGVVSAGANVGFKK